MHGHQNEPSKYFFLNEAESLDIDWLCPETSRSLSHHCHPSKACRSLGLPDLLFAGIAGRRGARDGDGVDLDLD
jgi:hypothetical protein